MASRLIQARKLHRVVAPILLAPLMLAALTGVAARAGRSWFAMPKPLASWHYSLHEGGFLGEPLVPFYVLAMGLGLLGLCATGLVLLRQQPARSANVATHRRLHSSVALVAVLPLVMSASSGILFRLLESWGHLPEEQIEWLMDLHQGAWLGDALKPVYVVLVGLGLVVLLGSGVTMLRRARLH